MATHFAKATVTYLGKGVGQGEVGPVQAKVEAILSYPVPASTRELMRFLGLVGYHRSFCPNFSTVVAPLTSLLKKNMPFNWSSHCHDAFECVKKLICPAPVLSAPDFQKPFKIQVDASEVGAGAVLLQEGEGGVDHAGGFFSRKFNRHQLNYSVTEKVTLALIWALTYFEVCVGPSLPVTVYTGHNPLTFLSSMHNASF